MRTYDDQRNLEPDNDLGGDKIVAGPPSSTYDALFFNSQRAELLNLLKAADLEPDPDDETQIAEAIIALAQTLAPQFTQIISCTQLSSDDDLNNISDGWYRWTAAPENSPSGYASLFQVSDAAGNKCQTIIRGSDIKSRRQPNGSWSGVSWIDYYNTNNTTIDSNGALKPASPIFRLANDPADVTNDQFSAAGAGGANGEARDVTAEHTATGVYVVSGSLGFATDGAWPIPWVIPQDGNGNNLVFVETEQADDGTITIRTYNRKFDVSAASVVADQPMDVPDGRWVDLRLKMPEPDESEPA